MAQVRCYGSSGSLRAIALALLAWGTLLSYPTSASASEGAFGAYQPTVLYHGRVSHSLYVAVRDGVRLAVRVSRPAVDGKPAPGQFPVIWQHTIDITEQLPSAAMADFRYAAVPSLTQYGYVVVQVARRGNGQSFGTRRGYNDRTEDDDAYDITEWLAQQPWSNGRIGIYGCSNTGDAAMHAVAVAPPHLKAAFAGCFSWSKWDAFHRGGLYAQWGVGIERTVEQDMKLEPVDGDEQRVLLHAAAIEHQRAVPLRTLWRSMPFRDTWSPDTLSRFWYEGSVSSYAEALRHSGVALYIQGGWHDELRDQGLIALMNYPGAHLVIGPWRHCMSPDFALLQEIHRFFDTYLKGIDTGLRDEPAMHYYVQQGNGGEWRSANQWPLAGMVLRRLYLAAGQKLLTAAHGQTTRSTFTVDKAPDCADGAGPFMQPCVRDGVGVEYRSPPLKEPTEVTGHPIVTLQLQSDRDDAHIFAYLVDIGPDGIQKVVTDGRLKASLRATSSAPWSLPGIPWHRGWAEDASPLAPGQSVSLQFDLMPTSYIFGARHRIGLVVSGSDGRESDPAPVGGAVTILSTAALASYVEIPVVQPVLAATSHSAH